MINVPKIDIDGGGGIPGGGTPPTHTTESAITSKRPISATQGTSYASWAGIAAAKVGGGTSYLVRVTIPDMPDSGDVWVALSTTKDLTGALAAWNTAGTYQVVVKDDSSPDTKLYLVSVNMAGLGTTPTPPVVSDVQVNKYDDTYTPDATDTTPALLQSIAFRDYVQAILDKHKTGIGWDNDSATAIDTDSGYDGVGVFFDSGETIGAVLDTALQGYTACKWCDADGKMQFTRLVDPSTQPIENSAITARTAGEMFFTGDGTTTQAQLSIGARNVSSPTITAIHQTDWQGRQLLYPTARTNYAPDLAASAWLALGISKGSAVPMGGAKLYTITQDTSFAQHQVNLQSSAPLGEKYFFVDAKAGTVSKLDMWFYNSTDAQSNFQFDLASGLVVDNPYNDSSTLPKTSGIIALGGGLYRCWASRASTVSNEGVRISVGGLFAAKATGDGTSSVYVGDPMLSTGGIPGAYIPTTTAPVTVTDYTDNGDGTIMLGQPLADGGTLDWDGSGTITIVGVVDENAMLTDLIPTQDTAPALSTRMGARRNWKQFADGDLVAPSLNFPPAVRQYFLRKFQQVMASAKAIDNTYIHAKYADPAPSAFDNADDAQTEIDRICDIYTTQRWFYDVEVALDAVEGIDLGQVWRLVYPLYGLESGKNVMVVTFQPDLIQRTAQITLWG